MAVLAFLVLILAIHTDHSCATWCVCKDGLGDAALQKTLDYACGAGADCNPIHQNAACYQPNSVKSHCSYAVNSFFQKKGQAQGTCDFAGTASISTTDPSVTGCVFPSSASAASTSTTPSTTTPSTTTPSTNTPTSTPVTTTPPSSTTPTTTSPYTTTPNGVLGGFGNGVGPSGAGISTDDSYGGIRLVDSTNLFSLVMTISFSGLMLWWG